MEKLEVNPFLPDGRSISTDDVIEELFRNRTWKYTALVLSLMVNWFAAPSVVYITAFAGLFFKLIIVVNSSIQKVVNSLIHICLVSV